MAKIARAPRLLPARERVLRDLAHGKNVERSREARKKRVECAPTLRDLVQFRLAVARGTARSGTRRIVGEIWVPWERIPEHDLEGPAGTLDLPPDHGGAALALRLDGGIAAGEGQFASGDEVALVHQFRLGAERDAGEAAATVAGRFAEQHHAGIRAARFDVGRHVGSAQSGRALARCRIALVVVAPRIEDAGAVGRTLFQDRNELVHRG